MFQRNDIKEGMTVYNAEGDKLGKVTNSEADSFVIEKGFFFPKDYRARYADVADVRGDTVHLAASRASLRGIEQPDEVRRTSEAVGREEVRVLLAEEQLDVERRARETGAVRITKHVITEQKQVTVPVIKEEVHVERLPATGELPPGAVAFQEASTTVPIYEEEVEVTKHPVVREEIRVTKERHMEQRAASAELRRETAEVEEEGSARGHTRRDDDLKHS